MHIFDVRNGRWEKITPLGEPPSPRAAHAAAAVGNMVVIQVSASGRFYVGFYAPAFDLLGSSLYEPMGTLHRALLQKFVLNVRTCNDDDCPRVASGQRVWQQRTCMSWTSPTPSGRAGTGGLVPKQQRMGSCRGREVGLYCLVVRGLACPRSATSS